MNNKNLMEEVSLEDIEVLEDTFTPDLFNIDWTNVGNACPGGWLGLLC